MSTLDDRIKLQQDNAVFLIITSFRGISPGATHYYGYLTSNGSRKIELKRTLTSSSARELTKLHNEGSLFDHSYHYEEGEEVPQFDDEMGILTVAKRTWKDGFPNKTELVFGDPAYWELYPTLDKR